MNTRRNFARRVQEAAAEENQAPPQALVAVEHVPGNPDGLNDGEVRNAFLQMEQDITTRAQAITAQSAREGAPRENPHASTKAIRLRDFTGMNPPLYYGSKAREDPLEFLDEIWYRKWADGRARGDVAITWDVLKTAFLERFFPREQREAKVEEFINLRQGGMSLKEYTLKFVKLKMNVSSLVENSRDEMSRFNIGISEDLVYGTVFHYFCTIDRIDKEKEKFELSGKCEKCFQDLKDRLTSAPVLTLPRSGEGCRSPIGLFKVGESAINYPKIVHEVVENVKMITDRLATAYSRQKSYEDKGKRALEFERVGNVTYELKLPQGLASVHPVFHVSMLKKFLSDPASILPVEGLEFHENLSNEEVLIEILDRQVKRLRNKEISIVKVLWQNHLFEGETWEAEADMRSCYPHLFSSEGPKSGLCFRKL
ncbi:uncharacterized protein LOC107030175 [Solanum pennellii]|uniref:Uncharacterized protein LOC107030175 n=1 Tax=Solanum pennellii TaxID=28526 RepID=A0ABM1HL10_SOLPN|nr:uncharacterized protein LOC107030175 [Solanum pennellii]